MKNYIITQETKYNTGEYSNFQVIVSLSSHRLAVETWREMQRRLIDLGYEDVSPEIPSTSYDGCEAECVYDTGFVKYRFRRWEMQVNALPNFPFGWRQCPV